MQKASVHEAERCLDATISHLKMQLAELRDEDRHIADRIRRLTRSVDELEEEYDKHLSWCTSPGMSPCDNGFILEDPFSPSMLDCVKKAASTSKLPHLSESSMEDCTDVGEGSSSPSSPSLRRVSMFEHDVTISKSMDFMDVGSRTGLGFGGKKTSGSWSPLSGSRRSSARPMGSHSPNYEQGLSGHVFRGVPALTALREQINDDETSLRPGCASIKKRHSFDVLCDREVNSAQGPPIATTSTFPRGAVLRFTSEPYAGIPDITYTPESGTVYERGTMYESETRSPKSERSASDCTLDGTLVLPVSMPITRSASTGGMVPSQRRVVHSLPRNQVHLVDTPDRNFKKENSRMVSLRSDAKLGRACQSLPRGMNPKMLQMYHSAESQVDPYLDVEDHSARAKRSQSYEGLDQFCDPHEVALPSRKAQLSKRWKLPFFGRKS